MPATTPGQAQQGPSLADAAKAFEGLLDLPDETIQDQQTTAAEEAPADEAEGVAAEAKPEETAADEADVGEAEATETEEKPEVADDTDRLVTVTIDGKTEAIPLKEVTQGYQRYSDYTRKTQELASHRQAVLEERQTYATMLVALRDQLQQTQPEEPNWDEVYASDPQGYARRRDEWRDKQDKIAASQFELSRLQGLQQQQNAEQLAQVVRQGREKMVALNPAWKDQQVWETERQAIVKYAREVGGYTPEEISQAYDPRAIVLMNKARKYDELMAQKPKPDAVRGPRVASAGASPQGGVTAKLNQAQQRLAKSGRVQDAAKVFEQLL